MNDKTQRFYYFAIRQIKIGPDKNKYMLHVQRHEWWTSLYKQ